MRKFYLIVLVLIGFYSITYAQFSSTSNGYYEVEVSSFGNYDMSGKTFYILSGDKEVSNKNLEFMCYKDMVTQSLIKKNAILSNNQESADVCVLMDYGIEDKTYAATSGSHHKGTGFIYTRKIQEYRRSLNLYAYNNKDQSSDPIMLWKINLSSDGYLNDLQTVFPFLAEAAVGFIGTSTEGKQRCTIQENDIEAYFIKNGYYLNDNLIWYTPHIVENNSNKPMLVHSVQLEEDVTRVNLLAKYRPGKLTVTKFKTRTYIVFKGIKHPIIAAYLPNQTGFVNYVNKNIYLKKNTETYIQLVFPTKISKGDCFDLVSYFNKKETKEFVRYKYILTE